MSSRATKKEREQFVALMVRELSSLSTDVVASACNKLMRHAATYCRLQEAQCNGDYPAEGPWADNRPNALATCYRCEATWARSSMRTVWRLEQLVYDTHRPGAVRQFRCKSCQTEDSITAVCRSIGCEPVFGGDPRGATVKLRVPSGKTNDWGQEGICVPNS